MIDSKFHFFFKVEHLKLKHLIIVTVINFFWLSKLLFHKLLLFN
jgi:hypothetical protein